MVAMKRRYWVLCELPARAPVLYRIREGFQEETTFKLSLEGYLGVHQGKRSWKMFQAGGRPRCKSGMALWGD